MNELIKALTELAIEATAYLREARRPVVRVSTVSTASNEPTAYDDVIGVGSGIGIVARPEGQQTGDQVVGKRKGGRPPKAVPAAPVISEDESLSEALSVAKEYVQRFQKATPDGLTRARAILAEKFKTGSIPALSHEQRLELIGMLKKELEAA